MLYFESRQTCYKNYFNQIIYKSKNIILVYHKCIKQIYPYFRGVTPTFAKSPSLSKMLGRLIKVFLHVCTPKFEGRSDSKIGGTK